jgi:hypothetical protein
MVKNKFLNLFVNVEVRGGIYRYISIKLYHPPPTSLKNLFYDKILLRICNKNPDPDPRIRIRI